MSHIRGVLVPPERGSREADTQCCAHLPSWPASECLGSRAPTPKLNNGSTASLPRTGPQDEVWPLGSLPGLLGQTHTSLFGLFSVHGFGVPSGGFQSKFLMLWPDWGTSKRQDGLADFQQAGPPAGFLGKVGLCCSHLTVPHKLLDECHITVGTPSTVRGCEVLASRYSSHRGDRAC